jgi:hypothetical protein
MGASGPNPISRLAVPPMLPGDQPWQGVQGLAANPDTRPIPGPPYGVAPSRDTWIGAQFAPGQGGDTPGAGGFGAGMGNTTPPQTQWVVDGYIVPQSQQGPHNPGWVSWVGSRRSGA